MIRLRDRYVQVWEIEELYEEELMERKREEEERREKKREDAETTTRGMRSGNTGNFHHAGNK